jgi:hypothetical protein
MSRKPVSLTSIVRCHRSGARCDHTRSAKVGVIVGAPQAVYFSAGASKRLRGTAERGHRYRLKGTLLHRTCLYLSEKS